ncbi:hypothetical protein DYB28_002486 [Aphanomyces astaci]|uniref:dual-specificity kinase n=1 Tax=Aphanomyces astaci TaxID=112090 RepID=A0A397EKF0_APHAT|nr:hypothetical protein DYB25_003695 [Aphanomyces astaci]RHY37637.1 hypothetical protein DYB38_002913 [Aphanomyces astaci]RHY38604.1 hypothetical protein DYB34_004690 [Aphanomyces astaci]RHY63645.1 hypothetical protein DYB30_003594 [Aphanomyces astaci]RHY96595.1 hypothetical protein DYB31_003169 [Aphanomyces astaci]
MELPMLRLRPGHRKHRSIRGVANTLHQLIVPEAVIVNDKTKAQVVAEAIATRPPPDKRHSNTRVDPLVVPPQDNKTNVVPDAPPSQQPPPQYPHQPFKPKEIVRGMDHHRTNTSQRSNPSTTKPMKPEEVLASATHAAALTIHEATEILDFPTVHYVGTAESKVRSSGVANNGFDDDKGDYIVNLHDHIAYRYDVVGHLGRGSFGQVLKCHDYASRQMVAVKIVRNKQKFQEQSVVEVQLLQHLNHADVDGTSNVIAMLDTFTFRNHLCLVFELLSISLYEYLKLEQFRGLPVPLLKKIATDVLHCLVFLHAQNVVHCDLKPENILVRKPKPMQVAVIDFGSSCFHHATFFTYIQSRFYRAPEVVLGLPYGMPIDMWSFACIMAELFTGYPVFPGENEGEQLACIMEVFDVPPKHMVDKCKRRKNFFNDVGEPTITINSRGRKRRPNSREFRALIKCQDLKFVDLLTKCFRWDPAMRCTPMEALDHEWLTGESKLAKPPVITPSTASSGGTTARPPDKSPHSTHRPSTIHVRKPHNDNHVVVGGGGTRGGGGSMDLMSVLPKI